MAQPDGILEEQSLGRLSSATHTATTMSTSDDSTPSRPEGAAPPALEDPVGTAHMRPDGTVELKLIAVAPGDIRGEAMFLVKPDDPRYQGVVDHLGGLKPGGYASVQPFPPGVF